MNRKIIKTKYYFDIGMSLFPIINFILLIITASDKIRNILPIPVGTDILVIILVPSTIFSMIAFGWFLDVKLHYVKMLKDEDNDRNNMLIEVKKEIQEVKELINK